MYPNYFEACRKYLMFNIVLTKKNCQMDSQMYFVFLSDDSLSSKQHTAGSAFLAGLARQASVPDRPVNRASPELSSSSSKTSTSSGSPSKTSSGDFATPSLKSLSSSKASSSGNVKFADDIFGKPGSSLSKTGERRKFDNIFLHILTKRKNVYWNLNVWLQIQNGLT